MEPLLVALQLVFAPDVLVVILGSAVFGIFVGAIPGLTSTMATALLIPVTFFMAPVPSLGAIVTATTIAIFAGDIPAAMLRMPGTPSSAAYTDESYAMAKRGQLGLNLGVNLVFSVVGGLFGVAVLITVAPSLAELALNFSSFEYFWLAALGLACALLAAGTDPLKALAALLLGLAVATVGIDPSSGVPRFTFGSVDLMSGIDFIPVMIGMFALSEIIRSVLRDEPGLQLPAMRIGNVFSGLVAVARRYWVNCVRGSVIGTLIGALPGAGADIAAWVAYAVSRRFSREPEKFGTGHVEGIVDASSANNSALGGTWIPTLVFGIPGDSITAIVIGVLYMKGLNPGPTIFIERPETIYAVFLIFILANLMMLPVGLAAIRGAGFVLRTPKHILMPIVLVFCVVGSFAITNSPFGIAVMIVAGFLGYLLEENGFPVAPIILGIVLGAMLEHNLITSLVKADGSAIAFVERPIAMVLGTVTLLVWGAILVRIGRSILANGPR